MARTKSITILFFSLLIIVTAASAVSAAVNVNFDQCANEDPTPSSCHWIGSALIPGNSNYTESMSVPQRLILRGIDATPGNQHVLQFQVLATKSGVHAYDFLTAYNQGNVPPIAQLNPCADLSGPSLTACNTLRNSSFTATPSLPDDPYLSKDGPYQSRIAAFEGQYGDRTIKIYANAPISNVSIKLAHDPGTDTGDTYIHYNISYTSNATAILIEMGGHLAVSGNSSVGWGPGLGASFISGGPYHFKLDSIDSDATGAKDNQIQAGSIQAAPQGNITVIKHVINNNGGTAVASEFTMRVNALLQNLTFPGSESGTTVTVLAGSYNVTETNIPGYSASYSANCTGSITDGQTKICVVTNDDVGASITVVKQIINDNGGTLNLSGVTLYIDGNATANGTSVSVSAGTHIVSEAAISGYTATLSGDCSANGTILVGLSDAKTCTITNNDIAPNLTVIKVVNNTNGGALNASAFALFIDGNATTTGQVVTLNSGTHVVSETPVFGYASSFSGDCDVNGTVTLQPGQSKTCYITNTAQLATLTVIKNVTNDNGGTLTASDFPLFVDNSSVTSGVPVNLPAGTYAVSEQTVSGYANSFSGDCAPNGSVSLAVGESKTCYINNNDIAGTLIVRKIVVNDNGGSISPANFTMMVAGNNPSPSSFPGDANGTAVTVDAGTYIVSETGPASYASAFSADCAGTIGLGEVRYCNVTNDDIPGTLRIIKQVINDNGGTLQVGDFNLYVDGFGYANGSLIPLNNGTHIVSENSTQGYVGTFSGDCDITGAVNITAGDAKTCTITNNDVPATLIVIKNVTNDNGGTMLAADFVLQVTGNNPNQTSFPGSSGTHISLDAGNYSVGELDAPGYAVSSSADCSGTIAVGETKTCIISNDDIAGGLVVTKIVINNNGGTLTPGDFTLYVNGSSVNSGQTNSFSAGTYLVTETAVPGYLGTFGGDCGPDGTVNVTIGEVKNCTLTNDDQSATITVTKMVSNQNGGLLNVTDFPLYLSGNLVTSGIPNTVNAGTYLVTENSTSGYNVSFGGGCDANGTISVLPGENKTCVVTNSDNPARLTVIKNVTNDNGGVLQAANFSLFIGAAPATSGVEYNIPAGTHMVSETPVFGYVGAIGGDCAANGSITLAPGQTGVCYINNDDLPGKLIVVKEAVNEFGGTLDPSAFTIHVNGTSATPTSFPGNASGTEVILDAGSYTAYEELISGYNVSYSEGCSGVIGNNETKRCVITNSDAPSSITVTKVVINDNGGTLAASEVELYVNGTNVTSGIAHNFVPGSYLVTEEAIPGYSASFGGDCAPNGTVTLALGEHKSCSITNDDQPAHLTVVKIVNNTYGGQLNTSNFTLYVNSSAVQNSVAVQLDAGAYLVSESATPGYVGVIGGACDANGNVILLPGDNKTCIITNQDTQGSLTVIKTVINDNGGTLAVVDFPLYINGNLVLSNQTVPLNAGTYTVSENTTAGYAAVIGEACAPDGTVSIAVGEHKVCTIVNDDQPAMLTVIKNISNDNGGLLNISDVKLYISGQLVANGTPVTLNASTYVVSEDSIEGYSSIIGGDCSLNGSITLLPGESKVCYITNDDQAATLTVIKQIINDNGGTLTMNGVTLRVDGGIVQNGSGNTVQAGVHNVSEDAIAGYSQSFSGGCDQNGLVSLQPGESKTCTITNDDQPARLTVVKMIVNDNGGTLGIENFTLKVNDTIVSNASESIFNAGHYVVSEIGPAGYAAIISGACDANGNVDLAPGENKTCYITNDDATASITVIKVVINDNGGTRVVGDFPLFLGETNVTSGVANLVNAGTYTVSELQQAGYNATFSGDCSAGSVTVSPGESKTCTITNDDIAPRLTVVKIVNNTNGGTQQPGDFLLYVNGTLVQSGVQNSFNAGAYLVTENGTAGYTAMFGGDCDAQGNVLLNIGDAKTCTVINSDQAAQLTVIKVVVNDNGGAKVVSDFPLFVGNLSVTSGIATALPAGTYLISETGSAGYSGSFDGDCDQNGSVSLAVGQSKTCTLTNNDLPAHLTVVKIVNNTYNGTAQVGNFSLFINTTPVTSGQTMELNAGAYVVSEAGISGYTGSFAGACDSNGNVLLLPGDNKTCYVTNDELPPLTCEQAVDAGLLRAEIINGTASVVNDANQSYLISLASYQMYALTIADQTLFDSVSTVIGPRSNASLSVEVPMCAYQIEIVCGEPVVPPFYGEDQVIAYDFGNQQNFCIKESTGDVDLSIAPYFPQNKSYVFICQAHNFTPTSYDWHFGDGEIQLGSANMNVFHTYAAAGNYTVTCTATNGTASGTGVLGISVGGDAVVLPPGNVTPPANQTNSTNQTNNSGNESGACYAGASQMPVSCQGGTIIQDEKAGCRTVICASGEEMMQIMACDKPDAGAKQYFEMYKQAGSGDFKICLGTTCISENGYARSSDFPICLDALPPNTTGNQTNQTNGTVTPPNNQTGNNTGNQTNNQTCATTIADVPVSCTGTIVQDSTSGVCRTIVCQSDEGNVQVLACDKPDAVPEAQYFEMYKQSYTGTHPTVCLGNTCISNNGFASGNYPVCMAMPPGNGTNQTNESVTPPANNTSNVSAMLSVAPWYPQGGNYVFECQASGFTPTSYDWYYGDGSKLLGYGADNVYHTYGAGEYTVTCIARNGETSATSSLQVSVDMPG